MAHLVNPLKIFSRPEYLFRPSQIFRRFQRLFYKPSSQGVIVPLPWGGKIKVYPFECVGAGIYAYGVFDLIVPETAARLMDSGEVGVDIGANIGFVSLLMAKKALPAGKVLAFEPHPKNFETLMENKAINQPMSASLEIYPMALGAKSLAGELLLPLGFEGNTGTARLASQVEEPGVRLPIQIETLDRFTNSVEKVHFCKIDVEGMELEVLQGAEALMRRKGIRDIVYEDVGRGNKRLQRFLQGHGYELFSLHTDLLKPRLARFSERKSFRVGVEGENFLATLDPDRARKRFASFGWKALRKG